MNVVSPALRDGLRAALGATGARNVVLRVELAPGAADALAALRLFEQSDDALRFFSEQPSGDRSIVALGEVARVEARGPQRFEAVSAEARSLFDTLSIVGAPAPSRGGPLLVGGFAFANEPAPADTRGASDWSGFAPASFVLPRLAVVREGPRCWITAAVRVGEPGAAMALSEAEQAADGLAAQVEAAAALAMRASAADEAERTPSTASEYCARPDRPHVVYLDAVAEALDALRAGELEKIVLARSLEVASDAAYTPASVLHALRRAHQACTVFAVSRGERVFLGATPERLVRLEGDRVTTAAVAGSAPRGRSREEDERLARALRESKKEQEEHAVVVREIEAALRTHCDAVERPEAPGVLALDGIQHLETPFEARLGERGSAAARASVFELAGALHPTPAVCGTPREVAAAWIERAEELERGWYAGAVGWADAEGGGELAVALRSGLLGGGDARLYAGAGIVPGSEPPAELRETRLKLRALLSQLTEI